ncbi:DUF4142 domain-containing protein [Microvirga sp. 2TAF3]|uniref:DUF4142 domain-containing protein n=1 Tax=Microvirga sp. 2TAF3 TaxID=3233014 RepID=UPI003F9BE6AF
MKKHIALAALLTTISAPAFAQQMDSLTFRNMAAQADAFEIASSRLALERSRNQRVLNFAQSMISDHGQTSQALNGGSQVYSANGEWMGSTVTGTLAGAGIGALFGGPVGAAVGAGVGAGVGATTGTIASAPVPGPKPGYDPNYDGPLGHNSNLRSGSLATDPGRSGAMDVVATGTITPIAPMPVQLDAEKSQMLNELASTSGPQFDRLYGRYQRAAHQETLALYQEYAQNGSDPALVQYSRSVLPHLEHHLAETRRLPGATGRR